MNYAIVELSFLFGVCGVSAADADFDGESSLHQSN